MLTSNMYVDAANASMRGAFASGVRQIDLEPGQLVLFPSWVLHDVKPYDGDGERITVAFNCWFQLKDGLSG
jgi:predicted 2-oxoglutarate/Fe(II)-dependent dioxygenase YbiX